MNSAKFMCTVLTVSALADISVQNKLDEPILFSLEANCDAQSTFLENQTVEGHSVANVPESLIPARTPEVCFVLKDQSGPLKVKPFQQFHRCQISIFKQEDAIKLHLSAGCHQPKAI